MPEAATDPAASIAVHLNVEWPVAFLDLPHDSPYGLLVALLIAIQASEARAARVAPTFIKRFPDIESLSTGDVADVTAALNGVPLANRKAATLITIAKRIATDFGGAVPTDATMLKSLPGIGSKTAAVIAGEYGDPTAFPVDRHLLRVASRLQIETVDLASGVQAVDRYKFALRLTLHGRHRCTQRKPSCSACSLKPQCPSAT